MTRLTRTRAIVLLAMALIGSAALWRVWYLSRPPLVPIGGQRLEARLKGMGAPTVVFEGGFDDALRLFGPLQDSIADQTQTLVYDRAGYGRSDPGREPRTAREAAEDLRALLAVLGVRLPAVLVCYSAGCLFTRVFAHEYPANVAGLVFIDPVTEASYAHLPRGPAESGAPQGARREWAALPATLEEARSAWPLPSVPSVVISALKPNGRWPIASRDDIDRWLKEQQGFLGRLSEAGTTHVVFPQADHESVLTEKDLPRAVLDLIARLKVQSWPSRANR